MQANGASNGANPRIQGDALRAVVTARDRAGKAPLTLAMVYPFSCHNYELRYWLSACGIDPDRDVRLLVLPPPLLVDALREGQIDGFCVGEPWNSLAVAVGVGSIVTATSAIWRLSPEKVLGCKLEWAQRHPDRMAAVIRAVYRAAQWCGQVANQQELASLLAEPRFVGAPAATLLRGLTNKLSLTHGEAPQQLQDFYLPAQQMATFPWTSHALWFYSQMVRWQQIEFSEHDLAAVRATWRPDLYRLALAPLQVNVPQSDSKIEGAASQSQGTLDYGPDGFFDGRIFDPDDLVGYLRGR
jgi:NitT/TauT family transport system ATP-binding protein